MARWLDWGSSTLSSLKQVALGGAPEADGLSAFTVESEGKLGLHFSRTSKVPYTVEKISSDGWAASEPLLQAGLRLVSVQGVPISSLEYDAGLALLRNSGRPMRLVFCRPAAVAARSNDSSASSSGPTAAIVHAQHTEDEQEFGLRVCLDSEEEELLVQRVRAAMLPSIDTAVLSEADTEFWIHACLRACKFDVEQTVSSLPQYLAWREANAIDTLGSIYNERLRNQLRDGFLQLTGARDRRGRLLLHAFARLLDTTAYTLDETMRAVHFVVEAALRVSPAAQARGFLLLVDLTDAAESTVSLCLRSFLYDTMRM